MEHAVEETLERVKAVYEMVSGQPAPEFSADSPYARIPPEVDREEYVLRQAAALFERVAARSVPKFTGGAALDLNASPSQQAVELSREGSMLCFVFDVGPTSREKISVELKGPELRVCSDRPVSTALLPARVEPSAVTAEFSDGIVTVRVRLPILDDAAHQIELR